MSVPLLAALDLRKSFGGITAVNGADVTIQSGELMCIIGPNGAGKSTLLNLLCGVTRADSGQILFDGKNIGRLPIHGFARAGIVRKFQTPAVFTSLTARENLRIARDAVGASYAEKEIDEMLERLALIAEESTLAGDLAHGKKQWLEIGLCLMTHPRLLLLDEPTAGMTDPETSATVMLLKSLATDTATVVIEHDMSFVRELNVRTCVMHQGEIVRDCSFSDIEKDPFIQEIYLGTE